MRKIFSRVLTIVVIVGLMWGGAITLMGSRPSATSASLLSYIDTLNRGELQDTSSLQIPDDTSYVGTDSLGSSALADSLMSDEQFGQMTDSLSGVDSLLRRDTLSVPDSLVSIDSLAGIDSLVVLDSLTLDSLARADSIAREDSLNRKYNERMRRRAVKDSLKAVRDSIRWSTPRVLHTGFIPDSLYYKRIIAWNAQPYVNTFKRDRIDTTYNDWYSEYPYYWEDVDVTYLGTAGSATQNVDFHKRRSFDLFKPYAPYLVWSYTPETLPMYNTKSPYTELAYWGTLFAYKDKEEINIHFLHTQNITPEFNFAIMVDRWGAAGRLTNEATYNNNFNVSANYAGENYVASAGFIHQNINRQENGGVSDPYFVRDTVVDAKIIPVYLSDARNKLSRNTVFINHSYSLSLKRDRNPDMTDTTDIALPGDSLFNEMPMGNNPLDDPKREAHADAQDRDRMFSGNKPADSLSAMNPKGRNRNGAPMPKDSLSNENHSASSHTRNNPAADGARPNNPGNPLSSSSPGTMPGQGMPPASQNMANQPQNGKNNTLAPGEIDSVALAELKSLGDGPMLKFGHIGELSRFYRLYTDNIGLNSTSEREFYHNQFYINPQVSADSTRVFSIENKMYVSYQPLSREAVLSQITAGVGHQWNSIYMFSPETFLTGNRNTHQNNLYFYAAASGKYRKYLEWNALARYDFMGYYSNDLLIDGNIGVSFYPFEDKTEPITLRGSFHTSLKEPDWFSQHYYSNHYVWENNYGKTSTTTVKANLEIPKWKMDAGFAYSLINNHLYNDTLGYVRQESGLVNVMSAYLRKDFKLWLFHLDNRVLLQYSSDEDILPLPLLSLHLRWYLQFTAVKDVLNIQIGADATFNTKYHAPAYNPALGSFQLQNKELIGNNPYIDVFVNLQWKRASIFLKVVNVGQGWPNKDTFSAYRYIKPVRTFKIGIHWPFYIK